MKKLIMFLTASLLLLSSAVVYAKNGPQGPFNLSGSQAHGPWIAKVEGSGSFVEGSYPYSEVYDVDLGWNFKVNEAGNYNGQLNIVEKTDSSEMFRHFKLFGHQVDKAYKNCNTHEVRVEGTNEDGLRVAAHFRGFRNPYYPNTVWYWVKDGSEFITNTAARLELDSPFFVLCGEDKVLMETLTVDANDPAGTYSEALYEGLEYVIKASGVASAGDTIDFDAKYSLTNRIDDDTWTDEVSGYTSYGPSLLDLMVNGLPVDWGGYNEDHTYYWGYMGHGNPLNFSVYDIYYPNNSGSLTVEIYAIP